MKPNQIGLITCIVLAAGLILILFVESKRPIIVEITVAEINERIDKEICNAIPHAEREKKEQNINKEKTDKLKKKALNQGND